MPDAQLTERELAELCGVSRTPIRDALRRLEAEMLVQRSDTQRWFIRKWDVDHVEEVFSLRCMLESHAAMRATTRATTAEIDELERLNDTILRAIGDEGSPDIPAFLAANGDFHRVILEAARSDRLATMRRVVFEPSSSGPDDARLQPTPSPAQPRGSRRVDFRLPPPRSRLGAAGHGKPHPSCFHDGLAARRQADIDRHRPHRLAAGRRWRWRAKSRGPQTCRTRDVGN